MPETSGDPIIRHVWRPRHDRAHIHYLAVSGTEEVHLRALVGDPIYPVLDDALTRMGYPDASYPGRVDGGVPPLTEAPMSWWRTFVRELAGRSRVRRT